MDEIEVVGALRTRVRGTVLAAGDAAWDAAHRAWARGVEQRPLAVVEPVDEADVVAVLAVAREHGATVAVQPTGHGASDPLEGAVVLRMGAFDRLDVDVEAQTARVGAGVLVGTLLAALDGTGLVAPSGSSRVVSVAGLVLGGGQGWFTRLGGLGGHWMLRARVVLPDGTATWIDDEGDHAETMRLLRGGGGLVAIATELELRLRPVRSLVGGSLDLPMTQAPAVLRAARDLVDAEPGVAASVALLAMPDSPALPAAIRGRRWCSVRVVLADADAEVLRTLRAVGTPLRDDVGAIAPGSLHAIANDPEEPAAGDGWSALVPRLDEATIDALVAARDDEALEPIVAIEVRLLAGTPTPLPALVPTPDEPWLLHAIAPIAPGGDGGAQRTAIASLADRLAAVTNDRALPTFLGTADLSRALAPDAIGELRAWRAEHGGAVLHPSRLPA